MLVFKRECLVGEGEFISVLSIWMKVCAGWGAFVSPMDIGSISVIDRLYEEFEENAPTFTHTERESCASWGL